MKSPERRQLSSNWKPFCVSPLIACPSRPTKPFYFTDVDLTNRRRNAKRKLSVAKCLINLTSIYNELQRYADGKRNATHLRPNDFIWHTTALQIVSKEEVSHFVTALQPSKTYIFWPVWHMIGKVVAFSNLHSYQQRHSKRIFKWFPIETMTISQKQSKLSEIGILLSKHTQRLIHIWNLRWN